MSKRPGEDANQDDPLTARLASRLTEPVGLIDTREPAQKYARTADWVAERFSLADRLSNRYAAEAQNTGAAQTYVLGRPLQPQISSLASESPAAGPGSFDQTQFSVSGPGHHTSESPPSSGEKLRVSRRSPQIALKSDMVRLKSHAGAPSKPEQAAPASSDETLLQRSTNAAYKQMQLAQPSSDETPVQSSSSAAEVVSRSPEAEQPLIRVVPTLEGVHAKIEADPGRTDDPPARSVQRRAMTTPPAQGTPNASQAIHREPETPPELLDGVKTDSAPASTPKRLTANTSTVQRKPKDTQSDSSRPARKSPARASSKPNSDQRPPVVQRRPVRSPRGEEMKKGEPPLTSIERDRQSPAVSPPALPLAKSRSSVQRKKKNEGSDTDKQQTPLGAQSISSNEPAVPLPPAHPSHDSGLKPQPLIPPRLAEPAHTSVERKQDQRAEESHLESESPGIGNSKAGSPESSPSQPDQASVPQAQIAFPADEATAVLHLQPDMPRPIESSQIIKGESKKPAIMPRENSRKQSSPDPHPFSLNASGGFPIQRKSQAERSRISPSDTPGSPAPAAAFTPGIASAPEEQPAKGNAGPGSLVAAEIRGNSGSAAEPLIIWRKTAGAGPAGGTVPNITSGQTRVARQSEASASAGTVGLNCEMPAAAPEAVGAPQGGGVDVGRITQQVLRDITRRLEVERERRGY